MSREAWAGSDLPKLTTKSDNEEIHTIMTSLQAWRRWWSENEKSEKRREAFKDGELPLHARRKKLSFLSYAFIKMEIQWAKKIKIKKRLFVAEL